MLATIIYGVQTGNVKGDKKFFISHCLGCGSISKIVRKTRHAYIYISSRGRRAKFLHKTANRSVWNVAKLKYLLKVLAVESCVYGDTKGGVTTTHTLHTQHIFSVIEKAKGLVQPKHVAFWITIIKCCV